MTTKSWRRWLLLAAGLTAIYGAGLVVVGGPAGRVFDILGFGMRAVVPEGEPRSYVLFVYAILGSVLTGWMVLIAGIAAGPLREGQPWAWPTLVVSLGTWFTLDTGVSLVLGSWQHAIFNLVFVAAFGLPLIGMRRAANATTDRHQTASR